MEEPPGSEGMDGESHLGGSRGVTLSCREGRVGGPADQEVPRVTLRGQRGAADPSARGEELGEPGQGAADHSARTPPAAAPTFGHMCQLAAGWTAFGMFLGLFLTPQTSVSHLLTRGFC